tara:strand:+ start:143 stop:607 length:465 start_codon:yes stop_codon:yes gene_type:complete
MVLGLEWQQKVVEKLLLDVEQKVEKNYPLKIKLIMIKIQSLNQKEHFKKILKQNKLNNDYFTIYFTKENLQSSQNNKKLNISFVMKKKVGTAVKRNKIKRKLKSVVQKILEKNKIINLDYTYIVFGKSNSYNEKFSVISNEMNNIFKKINNLHH